MLQKNKLGIFNSTWTNFRHALKLQNNIGAHEFEDKLLQQKSVDFKHSWSLMAHMHDLRVWTICYAPSRQNNLQRLQEIHRLNNEMWYVVSQAMWKRIILAMFLWFGIAKFGKRRYLNQGMFDSHDASYRDTTAHM